MILYATKQTIKELNIPMPNELSTFNNIMANKVIEEQTGDELLEWGLKLFYFDGRKCVQAINFASKLTLFLFDIKNEEIQWIANGIAIYLNELYSKDKNMNVTYEDVRNYTAQHFRSSSKNLFQMYRIQMVYAYMPPLRFDAERPCYHLPHTPADNQTHHGT